MIRRELFNKIAAHAFMFVCAATVISAVVPDAFSQNRVRNRYIVGDLRHHDFESKIFKNKRKLRILLPEGYARSEESYPVLYLQDGQNLFNPNDAQVSQMEWGVDETVHSLVRSRLMRKIIVVGIDNSGLSERGNEYLPWKDEFLTPVIESPQGAKYPEFLVDEVMPFVEKNYRVAKGPENTAIGGASYGALISLYTGLRKPDVFGGVILESPSFYVDDAKILDLATQAEAWPAKIHLGVGTNELAKDKCDPNDETHEAIADVRRLEKIIGTKAEVETIVEECSVHSEIAWGSRLSDALEFLFPYIRPARTK